MDRYRLHDEPDITKRHEAKDRRSEHSAIPLASLSSVGTTSTHQMFTDDRDGLDRTGRYNPAVAECNKRLKRLVKHLDEWLENGSQGTRSMAISKLKAEVSPSSSHGQTRLTVGTRGLLGETVSTQSSYY